MSETEDQNLISRCKEGKGEIIANHAILFGLGGESEERMSRPQGTYFLNVTSLLPERLQVPHCLHTLWSFAIYLLIMALPMLCTDVRDPVMREHSPASSIWSTAISWECPFPTLVTML